MTNSGTVTELQLDTDVLVIGGGPAGAWAAVTAASQGARVVLADKGYLGTSGATAPSGTGVWFIDPDQESREKARLARYDLGGRLAEFRWMNKVLDRAYAQMHQIAEWGYPFPDGEQGPILNNGLQGHEYMKLMRRRVQKAGVTILDHSPALELLTDEYGVGGARGVRVQAGGSWTVRAGAVVIATGGCAFLSKALGCNVLTGDGYLMAAEAGAEMSGMEFSNAYAISAAFSSVTKTAHYRFASFYYEDGSIVPGAASHGGRSAIARNLMAGRQVYARLDQVPEHLKEVLRVVQRNFFLPFDRRGIDPFTDLFPVTLRLEGTVRGTGGIRIVDEDCATAVPGLYAAGDAATRELICGGFTGGGSHNAAWAMSSGSFAGGGAARYALSMGVRNASRVLAGRASGPLTASSTGQTAAEVEDYVQAVRREVHPFERNLFRTGQGLLDSLGRLDELWGYWRNQPIALSPEAYKAREAAAMTATARWMYRSALYRTETRGMHRRMDFPEQDPSQHYRLASGGLDEVWVKPIPVESEVAAP